jgi:hypothetical protein
MNMGLNIAINMDFDHTCTQHPVYHQDPFLEKLGIDVLAFWNEVSRRQTIYESQSNGKENFNIVYLTLFKEAVEDKLGRSLTRADLLEAGKLLKEEHLYPGLPDFWSYIKEQFSDDHVQVGIISVGIKPILEGCSLVEPNVDIISAYDFITEDDSPGGRVIGPACTVSSDEKENVLIRLSYGEASRKGITSGRESYNFPLEHSIIIADGFSDRAMCNVGGRYGAQRLGIAPDLKRVAQATATLGDYFDEFHIGDYRPGSTLVNSIEQRIRNFH